MEDKKNGSILFDFDSIIDPVLSYIQYFKLTSDVFNRVYPYDLNYFKFRRIHIDIDLIKELGLEMDEEYYNKIPTPVYTSMASYYRNLIKNANGIIFPCIRCSNKNEEELIKKELSFANILIQERHKVNSDNYTRIIIGNIEDLLQYKNLITTNIVLLDYKSNKDKDDEDMIPKEYGYIFGDINTFSFANAFNIPEPKG